MEDCPPEINLREVGNADDALTASVAKVIELENASVHRYPDPRTLHFWGITHNSVVEIAVATGFGNAAL
jgi:hypothetical protein